jgi:hypothetical protein
MISLQKHINSPISIAPLAAFRILFGCIMLISTIRFMAKGWIEQLYVSPDFYFTYYGFDWVQPFGLLGMYTVFTLLGLAALGIMLGYRYHLSTILFFIGFSYVELLDKSNYLNHYYFVSIISFLLIWVPANKNWSLDVWRKPDLKRNEVPAWCINIFKLQLGIVYFYAGLAKLNPDWLLHAMPLKIWLPAHTDLPIIGKLLTQEWVAYAFSWSGALYDLFIPFLLLMPATRMGAFFMVVTFHILTRILFPIGMFPYIMILSTLIFFSPAWHERNFKWIGNLFNTPPSISNSNLLWQTSYKKGIYTLLMVFFTIQLLAPFRYQLYNGNLFWTEQGYRFSWRVMLAEKAGNATFYVKESANGKEAQIDIQPYLAPHQEKQMSFQPDMILQFAHFLENEYQKKGIENPIIRAEVYVTLNGRKSELLIDPTADLTEQSYNLRPRNWILPQTFANR